jgi:hypothetical protein
VVLHALGPAIADEVGTTGTTRTSAVVPAWPERKAQRPQRVVEDGTTGTTGTTQIEVFRAEEVEHGSGSVMDAEDWQAIYDERAAIREFDAGLPRAEAERLAYADTVAELGQPLPGVQLTPSSAAVIAFDPSRRQRG